MSSPKTSHCIGKCFQTMATIINRWDLVEFKNLNGKCRVGTFKRSNGETFAAVTFGEAPDWKIVYFSEKVGVLTPAEIVAQKDDLQVILRDNQTEPSKQVYSLCRKGKVDLEDVDL